MVLFKDLKFIVFVIGESGVGKDFCVGVWVFFFIKNSIILSVLSISEVIKCVYVIVSGVDLNCFFEDCDYKE